MQVQQNSLIPQIKAGLAGTAYRMFLPVNYRDDEVREAMGNPRDEPSKADKASGKYTLQVPAGFVEEILWAEGRYIFLKKPWSGDPIVNLDGDVSNSKPVMAFSNPDLTKWTYFTGFTKGKHRGQSLLLKQAWTLATVRGVLQANDEIKYDGMQNPLTIPGGKVIQGLPVGKIAGDEISVEKEYAALSKEYFDTVLTEEGEATELVADLSAALAMCKKKCTDLPAIQKAIEDNNKVYTTKGSINSGIPLQPYFMVVQAYQSKLEGQADEWSILPFLVQLDVDNLSEQTLNWLKTKPAWAEYESQKPVELTEEQELDGTSWLTNAPVIQSDINF